MSILEVSLYAVIFIVALLLIVLILIQPSKSGGMGAAFGGIGESVFGGKAGSHLTKTTVIMTTIFFIVALGLAAVIGHKGGSKDEAFRNSMTVGGSGEKEPEKAAEAAAEKEESGCRQGFGSVGTRKVFPDTKKQNGCRSVQLCPLREVVRCRLLPCAVLLYGRRDEGRYCKEPTFSFSFSR